LGRNKLKLTIMKKSRFFSLFACLAAIAIIFGSCGGNKNSQTAPAAKPDSTTSVKKMSNAEKVPMVVDFYATWCGPCKELAKVMKPIEAEYGSKIEFKRIDIDQEKEMAEEAGIDAVPTLIYLDADGNEITRTVGLISADELKANLDGLLKGNKGK
jgi:thioredoxin 1